MKLHTVLSVLWLGAAHAFPGDKELTSEELFNLLGDVPTTKRTVPVTKSSTVPKGCGLRRFGIGFKGGMGDQLEFEQSDFGEFTWTVAVFDKTTGNYNCVGSLIHPSVVLTVGHRVSQGGSWLIRAGDWRLNDTSESFMHQERDVSDVVVHHQMAISSIIKNNIALLFLSQPVTVSEHIGFICLPSANQVTPPGTSCIATGWGQDKFVNGRLQNVMKMVEMPIVEGQDCVRRIRTTTTNYAFKLHNTVLCAGGEVGIDTCTGDGGGPLVCPYQDSVDRYYQAGIVAAGVKCGLNVPGLYTDVASLRDWIDDQVLQRGYKTDTYTASAAT